MRALVVVDYQNDFVDGSLGGPDAVAIEGAVCARMSEYLGAGDAVFVTMDTHGPDYPDTREGVMLPVSHCVRGTDGWMLHGRVGEIASRGGCTVIEKNTFGCSLLLRELAPFDSIELCGVATNVCVLANAVIARTANPQARIVVRRDCVASYDRDLGEKALDVMASLQVEVL
ncbi:MAG: isochorismatase family cysteine hydrolase [Thermoplasmata archaeon]|nr:isochorismatase family cysteine hydrolase [Thermoplasmata archaeon]